jgi:phosphoglycolate phosphatase-like HAD superfamily hydrolase
MKALIFDLGGTLVDTVYAHVFAWQRALAEAGLPIDGWRIHRRIATFLPRRQLAEGGNFDESDCGNGSGRWSGWDDVGGAAGAAGSDKRCHR